VAISDLIAIGAILVSLLSVYFSFRANKNSLTLQKEQIEMQERITQIEEAREQDRAIQSRKANLKAELRKVERNNYRLVINNSGQETARNVKATLNGKPLSEHPAVLSSIEEDSLIIGPHSTISYVMFITNDMAEDKHPGKLPSFEFEATWEDDSGELGEYETTLTFG